MNLSGESRKDRLQRALYKMPEPLFNDGRLIESNEIRTAATATLWELIEQRERLNDSLVRVRQSFHARVPNSADPTRFLATANIESPDWYQMRQAAEEQLVSLQAQIDALDKQFWDEFAKYEAALTRGQS